MTIFKTTLSVDQQKGFAKSRKKHSFALLMAMGTGKTRLSIEEMFHFWQHDYIDAVVVIVGIDGLQENWIHRELKKHVDQAAYLAAWRSGYQPAAQRRDYEELITKKTKQLKIFVLNIHQCLTLDGARTLMRIWKQHRCYTIIDESDAPGGIKGPDTTTTGFFKTHREKSRIRRIATGTVIAQAPTEAFSQFWFLDPRIIGQSTFTTFKTRYCKTIKKLTQSGKKRDAIGAKLRPFRDYYLQTVDYKNLDDLQRRIKPYSFTAKLGTAAHGESFSEVYCDMTAEQKRLYHELELFCAASITEAPANLSPEDKIIWLVNNADVCPEIHLTKILRLQQITTGHVKDDDGNVRRIKSNKPKAVNELLQTLPRDEQVVIWCHFTEDIAMISELLDKRHASYVTYYGATKTKDRFETRKKFEDRKVQYFVANPAVGGVGVDELKVAFRSVWYSIGPRTREYLQANARLTRRGQQHHVHHTHIIARGSHDMRIVRTHHANAKRMDDFLYG